ncbi:MAG TPA: GPP34 family phosphoprotein [Stellaceae bacterium]|jgi:hypothetical protein|nr:GPP34 family phosphoprotein [Stellaceae bacterium]
MLSFVEEIVLLQLDDTHDHQVDLLESAANVVLAGAALMDLALRNRIDADLRRLFVVDRTPIGDDILDDVLQQLAVIGGDLSAASAIEWVTQSADKYHKKALQRLVAKGILREEEGRFFWMFRAPRYPVVDDREQRVVKARLRELVLSDEIPDPNDVVLICLVDACHLLDLVLTSQEIDQYKPRVEQLCRLDLIGQAVTKAVAEIQMTIKHAVPPRY